MLNIKGLEKTFNRGTPDERKVLRGIDLHLEEGEFVTIVGGNGAGKTTLFNAISGAVLPDGGRVELGSTTSRTGLSTGAPLILAASSRTL